MSHIIRISTSFIQPGLCSSEEGMSLFLKETKSWKSTCVSWGRQRGVGPLSPLLHDAL